MFLTRKRYLEISVLDLEKAFDSAMESYIC